MDAAVCLRPLSARCSSGRHSPLRAFPRPAVLVHTRRSGDCFSWPSRRPPPRGACCWRSSFSQLCHRPTRVLALLAEQQRRLWLVVADRANDDLVMHLHFAPATGRARDFPGCRLREWAGDFGTAPVACSRTSSGSRACPRSADGSTASRPISSAAGDQCFDREPDAGMIVDETTSMSWSFMPAVLGARLGALREPVAPSGCGGEATFLTPASGADEDSGTSRTPRPTATS